MSNEIQVLIDWTSKWITKKVNKYISMMIKHTEKLETNIKIELQKKKKMYCKNISQKIAAVTIPTFTCASSSTIAPMHSQCSYPVSYAIR